MCWCASLECGYTCCTDPRAGRHPGRKSPPVGSLPRVGGVKVHQVRSPRGAGEVVRVVAAPEQERPRRTPAGSFLLACRRVTQPSGPFQSREKTRSMQARGRMGRGKGDRPRNGVQVNLSLTLTHKNQLPPFATNPLAPVGKPRCHEGRIITTRKFSRDRPATAREARAAGSSARAPRKARAVRPFRRSSCM